ncbi:MAG TPA: hypothetical protein VN879_03770 [Candidatus Acidoferrales bacterium]|nr:hypothetical protein [Candidatus Acidoferrales bacterium]
MRHWDEHDYEPIRHNFAGFDSGQAHEALRREGQKIGKTIGPAMEDDDGDLASREILFVLDALIHGQQDVEGLLLRQ